MDESCMVEAKKFGAGICTYWFGLEAQEYSQSEQFSHSVSCFYFRQVPMMMKPRDPAIGSSWRNRPGLAQLPVLQQAPHQLEQAQVFWRVLPPNNSMIISPVALSFQQKM